jgi:hypothetical protein
MVGQKKIDTRGGDTERQNVSPPGLGTDFSMDKQLLYSPARFPDNSGVENAKLRLDMWVVRVLLTARSVAAAVPRSKEPARRNFAQQGSIASGPDVWTEPREWSANMCRAWEWLEI